MADDVQSAPRITPEEWAAYLQRARASTQAINQMPHVLDPQRLAGLSPDMIKAMMYPGFAPAQQAQAQQPQTQSTGIPALLAALGQGDPAAGNPIVFDPKTGLLADTGKPWYQDSRFAQLMSGSGGGG